MIALPAGYRARPLGDDDVDEVVALVQACEAHDGGEPGLDRADLVSDLALVDRERDALVVTAAEVAGTSARPEAQAGIVAWGMVVHRRTRAADVAPAYRGRGVGAALVAWSLERGRQLGSDRIGQTVEDGRTDAVRLFESFGARPVRTAWLLRRGLDPQGPPPALAADPPVGVVLGASTPDNQDEALDVMELAFREWPDRAPSTREVWQALVTRREGFRDDQLQVAVEDGRVVGAAVLLDDGDELWVDKLATHPQARNRGIGRALLARAMLTAHARGLRTVALSTDSNTGALDFYQRLGMVVQRSFTHWAVTLPAVPCPA